MTADNIPCMFEGEGSQNLVRKIFYQYKIPMLLITLIITDNEEELSLRPPAFVKLLGTLTILVPVQTTALAYSIHAAGQILIKRGTHLTFNTIENI